MRRLLIEVTSPAAGKTYDMFVPDTLRIGEIIQMISGVFIRTSNGTYSGTDTMVLCKKNTGHIYDPKLTVNETDITNGSKLILF